MDEKFKFVDMGNWFKRWHHKLFKCPTFWKLKPAFTCPKCRKKYRCYWDGNDIPGYGNNFCNACAKEIDAGLQNLHEENKPGIQAELKKFRAAAEAVHDLRKAQCSNGTWNSSPYDHGMANAFILADSIINNLPLDFLEAPVEGWMRLEDIGDPVCEEPECRYPYVGGETLCKTENCIVRRGGFGDCPKYGILPRTF